MLILGAAACASGLAADCELDTVAGVVAGLGLAV